MIAGAKPKILLLDDDAVFLNVLALYLKKRFNSSVHISKFTSAQSFICHIEEHSYLPETQDSIVSSLFAVGISQEKIEQALIDLASLPALLVIDHQLRGENTNGIEISKKVREIVPSSYIALLTAEVNVEQAVSLHNHDTINLFVRKDSEDPLNFLHQQLIKQIEKSRINIDLEDIFGFSTVLEMDSYIVKRRELLDELDYQSFIITSKEGDIAVLEQNNKINHYTFSNGVFYLNG